MLSINKFTASELIFTIPKFTYSSNRMQIRDRLVTCSLGDVVNDDVNDYDDVSSCEEDELCH